MQKEKHLESRWPVRDAPRAGRAVASRRAAAGRASSTSCLSAVFAPLRATAGQAAAHCAELAAQSRLGTASRPGPATRAPRPPRPARTSSRRDTRANAHARRHHERRHAVQRDRALHHAVLLCAHRGHHRGPALQARRPADRARLHGLQAQVLHQLGHRPADAAVRPVRAARRHAGPLAGQRHPAQRARPARRRSGDARRPRRPDHLRHVLEPVPAGPRPGHAARPGRHHARLAEPRYAHLRRRAGRGADAGRAAPPALQEAHARHQLRLLDRLQHHVHPRVHDDGPLAVPHLRRPQLARPDSPARLHGRHVRAAGPAGQGRGQGALGDVAQVQQICQEAHLKTDKKRDTTLLCYRYRLRLLLLCSARRESTC